MIHIAFCDDESEMVSLHEDIIKKSLKKCNIGYEIASYSQSATSSMIYQRTIISMIYSYWILRCQR